MSGPVFEPSKWNDNKYIRKSHNCYAYALDRIDMKMAKKCKKFLKVVKHGNVLVFSLVMNQIINLLNHVKLWKIVL